LHQTSELLKPGSKLIEKSILFVNKDPVPEIAALVLDRFNEVYQQWKSTTRIGFNIGSQSWFRAWLRNPEFISEKAEESK
jgi:hypothetical protein